MSNTLHLQGHLQIDGASSRSIERHFCFHCDLKIVVDPQCYFVLVAATDLGFPWLEAGKENNRDPDFCCHFLLYIKFVTYLYLEIPIWEHSENSLILCGNYPLGSRP